MANESPHLDDLIHQVCPLAGDGGGAIQHQCGTTHKTVDIVAAYEVSGGADEASDRASLGGR